MTFAQFRLTLVVISAASLAAQSAGVAQPEPTTVAIFVTNRVGSVGDSELGALEDYITGRVSDLNVRIISGETALDVVAGM